MILFTKKYFNKNLTEFIKIIILCGFFVLFFGYFFVNNLSVATSASTVPGLCGDANKQEVPTIPTKASDICKQGTPGPIIFDDKYKLSST